MDGFLTSQPCKPPRPIRGLCSYRSGRLPVEAAPDGMSGFGHMISAVTGFLSHRDAFWPLEKECVGLYSVFWHSCLKWTSWERDLRRNTRKNGQQGQLP